MNINFLEKGAEDVCSFFNDFIEACRPKDVCLNFEPGGGVEAFCKLCEEALKWNRGNAERQYLRELWYEVFYDGNEAPEMETVVRQVRIVSGQSDAEVFAEIKAMIAEQEAWAEEWDAEIKRLKSRIREDKIDVPHIYYNELPGLCKQAEGDKVRTWALGYITEVLGGLLRGLSVEEV